MKLPGKHRELINNVVINGVSEMSFAQMIKFSELTKLLEAVSTSKSIKKRDEFMQEYFKKLHKFRDEFRKTNPNEVNFKVPWRSIIF